MQERQWFPIPLRIRDLRHKSQHLTRLHYLHLPTRRQFQQKGWVHKSKVIYISHQIELKHQQVLTSISNNINNNISFHHFISSLNYNNYCGDISPTTTPTPTMQRHQLCNDINYKCNMHVVPFYARWMTSIPGHEPSTVGWLKHPRA